MKRITLLLVQLFIGVFIYANPICNNINDANKKHGNDVPLYGDGVSFFDSGYLNNLTLYSDEDVYVDDATLNEPLCYASFVFEMDCPDVIYHYDIFVYGTCSPDFFRNAWRTAFHLVLAIEQEGC